MEENKENLSLNNENQGTNSDTDTKDNQSSIENSGYDLKNFEESFEPTEDLLQSNRNEALTESEFQRTDEKITGKPKKKKMINTTIIISAVIVFIFAITLFIVKGFFDTSIIGDWYFEDTIQYTASSSDDEVTTIKLNRGFEFTNDGIVKLREGTFTTIGSYSIQQSESGSNTITLYVPMADGYPIQGTFAYDVSGNIFTGRTFVISSASDSEESSQLELKSGKIEMPTLERTEEFQPNEDLVGKWTYSDGYHTLTFEFKEDGSASSNQDDTYLYDYLYSCSTDTITRIYYTSEQIEDELTYSISGDTLTLNGIPFTKEITSTADEN